MKIQSIQKVEIVNPETGAVFTTNGDARLENAPDWLEGHPDFEDYIKAGVISTHERNIEFVGTVPVDMDTEMPLVPPQPVGLTDEPLDPEVTPKNEATPETSNINATTEPLDVPSSEVPTPDEDEHPGEPVDGDFSVKSLAAKIGLTVKPTKALLKEKYDFEAENGSTIVPEDLFHRVYAENPNL